MQLGMIGLGRMGAGLVRRLMRSGHHCVVYDRNRHFEKMVHNGIERFTSRGEGDFAAKLLSALRYEFGGHEEKA